MIINVYKVCLLFNECIAKRKENMYFFYPLHFCPTFHTDALATNLTIFPLLTETAFQLSLYQKCFSKSPLEVSCLLGPDWVCARLTITHILFPLDFIGWKNGENPSTTCSRSTRTLLCCCQLSTTLGTRTSQSGSNMYWMILNLSKLFIIFIPSISSMSHATGSAKGCEPSGLALDWSWWLLPWSSVKRSTFLAFGPSPWTPQGFL